MGSSGGAWGAAIDSVSAALQAQQGNQAYQKAADYQKAGAAGAKQNLLSYFGQGQQYMQPYYQQGLYGLQSASEMLKPGYQFQGNPAYQFRMAVGQKALERGAAAKGTILGGGAQKSLARYSQGLASQEYDADYVRRMNLAGMGMQAGGALMGSNERLGGSLAGLDTGLANAMAANTLGKYYNWAEQDSRAAGAWSGYLRGGEYSNMLKKG
jgi:hypothetical protein